MIKTLLIAALATPAAALLVPAAPALAETSSAMVKTSDLDLSTASGARQLQRRIAGAVGKVCAWDGPQTGLLLPTDVAACRTAALRSARTQVAAAAHTDIRIATR